MLENLGEELENLGENLENLGNLDQFLTWLVTDQENLGDLVRNVLFGLVHMEKAE